MIRSAKTNDPKAIEASFSVDLPGVVGSNEMPNEIQWAPPGIHSINCTRGGQPVALTVNVNENGARKVAAKLAEYLATAVRGEGDMPFADFNHSDGEASFHPKSARWGGDDIQRGGVRMAVEWTGAGRRAVIGRDYSRFSPSFYVDDATREIIGLPVNVGGAVNRAAFQRIAPFMSKRAEADALTSPGNILIKAKAIARARNLSDIDAISFVAKNDPYLYDCYRWELFGGGGRPPKRPEKEPIYASAAYQDEFCIQARALADALDLNEADAILKLAHSQPALYERYRAKLGLGDRREYQERVCSVQARAEASEFFILAKRIAGERAIDITAAFDLAARQQPDLYDAYRLSL